MYSKMFELINDELNFLNDNTLELKKIEIKSNKVKFVFLDKLYLGRPLMKVKVRRYEMDWFPEEPKLKFKKEYLKPFNDKYFR